MAHEIVPPGYHTVTPYLTVPAVEPVLEFLKAVFGIDDPREAMRDDEGILRHTEVQIGDSIVMLGRAGDASTANTAMLYVYVADVDATWAKAMAAGAAVVREVADQFYGDRSGGFKDPAGTQWWIAQRIEALTSEEIQARFAESKR